MNTIKTILLGLFSITLAHAQAAPACKRSLIHFTSQSKEVSSKLIGYDRQCDGFGGNEVFTPRNNVRIYVSFNIAGTIDLDEVDNALERLTSGRLRPTFQQRDLAVISSASMTHLYSEDFDSHRNGANTTLFVSGRVLQDPKGFEKVVEKFYAEKK